ncbi:hypothetical protein D3C79_1083490 [compost metagenome]
MLTVNLALLRWAAIEVVDRGKNSAQRKLAEGLQGMHQYRIVGCLTNRAMKRVIQLSLHTRIMTS